MSAVAAAIAPEPADLTVEALQALWAIPNNEEIPATPHELILYEIHASCDDIGLYGRHVEVLLVPDGKKKAKSRRKEGSTRKIETRPRVMQDEMPASIGPSNSPGAWLTHGLIDSLGSEVGSEGEEFRDSLREVQESFRGYRHSNNHRCSFLTGENNFNLFFPKDTARIKDGTSEIHRYNTNRDAEREDWKPKKKRTKGSKKAKVDPAQKIAPFTRIADEEFVAVYNTWLRWPTGYHLAKLSEAAYNFVSAQTARTWSPLRDRGELDDAQSEFLEDLLLTLANKRYARQPLKEPIFKYVSSAWKKARKGAVIRLAKSDRETLADETVTDDSGDTEDDNASFSALEKIAYKSWSRGENADEVDPSVIEEREEAQKARLREAIAEMPEPERSMFQARLAGQTQVEIAGEHGLTQPAISQRMAKGEKTLKEKVA